MTMPTKNPWLISSQNTYLYYTTITFGLIILGTSLLMIARTTFKTCETTHRYYCQQQSPRPILTRFRQSLVPTDAILINSRQTEDKPPDYASVVTVNDSNLLNSKNQDEKTHFYSESPPPSYGSISQNNNTIENERFQV